MRFVLIPLMLAAGLAGCDGDNAVRITTTTTSSSSPDALGVLKVVDALQCPQTLGALTRKGSADPGGAACTYGGPRGSEVVLHLVPLDGRTAEQALARFEQDALAAMPQAAVRIDARADAGDQPETASVQAPGVNIQAKGEDATVSLPGLHIETQGDKASVRIAGINIQSADGQGVRTEKTAVSVDSAGDTTRVRTRAPGDSTRVTFLLADDAVPPGGWRQVGFEARGPAGGPLVVAAVRSKDRHDRVFDAAKDLVALNVGD
ncbi:MAG: methyltransferase type 11 [Brevundimonas sp.]|uniref:methyltransferase type 11 n=1 Tax=Brevundimonas sp. TaxID=1871086 RepID=UPI002589D423|nr:methyltransferase type 11 [Brevundimonas sp.]MCV0413258.1 methyltransferase type 11 [Brevundimonas sp.]